MRPRKNNVMKNMKISIITFLIGVSIVGARAQIVIPPQPFISSSGIPIGPILFPDGSSPAPSIAFQSNPATGFWKNGTALNAAIDLSINGVQQVEFTAVPSANFTGDLRAGAANFIYWNTKAALGSPANSQLNITNNAATTGIGLDVSTDGLVAIRNILQNADGKIKGIYVSTGTGLAVANVGANSCGTTAATIAGGNNAFVITVGATSGTQCRVTFTFAAGTEWDCAANDDTTTVAVRTTPVDTTHTDFIGTFTAGDKVTGICFPR